MTEVKSKSWLPKHKQTNLNWGRCYINIKERGCDSLDRELLSALLFHRVLISK